MTSEMWEKVRKARNFALTLENRNYAGNLSAGFLMENGEEIANLAMAFQALNELVEQIRSELSTPQVGAHG